MKTVDQARQHDIENPPRVLHTAFNSYLFRNRTHDMQMRTALIVKPEPVLMAEQLEAKLLDHQSNLAMWLSTIISRAARELGAEAGG